MVRARSGVTKLGCLVYLLIVAAVVYFGIGVGEVYFRYLEYKDAMKQEIRYRSQLTNEQIAARLKLVADSLGLPEDAGVVTVRRDPVTRTLTIEAHYDELIDIPLKKKEIHLQPRASGNY